MKNSNHFTRRKFIKVTAAGFVTTALSVSLPVSFMSCKKEAEFDFEKFLEISSILTGYEIEELNQQNGELYYQSLLEFPVSNISLSELYEVIVKSKDNLEYSQISKNADYKKLSDLIITYWYTASYKTADGKKMSDYEDQLAWKSTGYVTPNAQCHGDMGFWADKPNQIGA